MPSRAALLLLPLLVACPSSPPIEEPTPPAFDPALAAALQAALEAEHDRLDVPGMTAAVVVREGDADVTWVGATGLADADAGTALRVDDAFGIASISKTFTTALALQLVDGGLLTLDDTVEQHVPGLHPRGAEITVRQLMQHTAGIPECTLAPEFQADPTAAWTEQELVAIVADDPLENEPGEGFAYSNTHTIVLALIVEAAGTSPWRPAMRDCLFAPLELDATRVPSAGEGWGPLVSSYVGDEPVTRFVDPFGIGSAGGVVSTARDTAVWIRARFGGGLLSDAMTLASRDDVFPVTDTVSLGLGALVVDHATGLRVAHDGALNGFASWAEHRPESDVSIAVLANGWRAGSPVDYLYPNDVAEALWAEVEER